jgi:uncharacterized protein YggE
MKRLVPNLAIIALGALILAGCGTGNRQPAAASSTAVGSTDAHTITTRGIGKVTGVPDTLTVILGVQTQDPSAKAALDANNQKANALIGTLKGKGVSAKDLQTSGLSIEPTYNEKSTKITGYQVTNTLKATLHNLTGAGVLIDAAANAAGDSIRLQQISFSIGDDTALLAQARSQAVIQAKAQAGQIAKAAGTKLARIRSISDLPTSGQARVYTDLAMASAARSTPIEVGSQELSVTVDITYDIE